MLFRDLVQKVLKEGRLQFGENPKSSMQVDVDPLYTEEAHYAELVEILMVEVIVGFDMDIEKVKQNFAHVDEEMKVVSP